MHTHFLGKEYKGTFSPEITEKIKYEVEKMYLAGKIKAPYSAHDFRHYFATTEYQKDHDIYRTSIAVLETYLKSINVVLLLPIILDKPVFSFTLPPTGFMTFMLYNFSI